MAASPSISCSDDDGADAICCMCGDRGVPHELFRCNLCRLRSQHRYCSELYPRETAAAYRRCNWCLRKDGALVGVSAAAAAVGKRRNSTSPESTTADEGKISTRRSCGGCSRSDFSAEPGRPVKKPKLAGDKKAAAVVLPAPEAGETTKGRKPQAAAGKSRFKVKVRRRYKLLAELMISCQCKVLRWVLRKINQAFL